MTVPRQTWVLTFFLLKRSWKRQLPTEARGPVFTKVCGSGEVKNRGFDPRWTQDSPIWSRAARHPKMIWSWAGGWQRTCDGNSKTIKRPDRKEREKSPAKLYIYWCKTCAAEIKRNHSLWSPLKMFCPHRRKATLFLREICGLVCHLLSFYSCSCVFNNCYSRKTKISSLPSTYESWLLLSLFSWLAATVRPGRGWRGQQKWRWPSSLRGETLYLFFFYFF